MFAFDAAQNDWVRYYRLNTGPSGSTFINDRADVVEGVVKLAIGLGFKKIMVANAPPLHLMPGSSGLGATKLANLASDITAFNAAIGAKVNALKLANPNVQFYKADWNTAFTNAINGVGIWSGVSMTANVEAQNPGLATSQPAGLMVKWWDIANAHPSATLHKYMADNFISLW
ncbi:MAG: hypothetical protein CFE44_02015 [Burkholderiales bacterium PBB4]|nr:MAG: hypothetical protein CFE44_02015 [Burkholderiales bacterium PBB4]